MIIVPNPNANFEAWLSKNLPQLERLKEAGLTIIRHHLDTSKIEYLDVHHRVKDLSSANDKQIKKRYTSPEVQMTDLVGLRVIVYLESDVARVEQALRESFEIDDENSVDKRKTLVDRVGYRSVHLVCCLGKDRSAVPEYSEICGMPFEIQIRTALEHTWAEIEHKQNYKGDKALPEELQRRLMILSGTLELVDKEFDNIVQEAANYVESLSNSEERTLGDSVSATSARALVGEMASQRDAQIDFTDSIHLSDVIRELERFGIITNSELRDMLEDVGDKIVKTPFQNNTVGTLRDAMMAKDLEKYLRDAYRASFTFNRDDVRFLQECCGYSDVRAVLQRAQADYDDISFEEISEG